MVRSEASGLYRSTIDNLSALRAFVAVVECGSFSEAGYRLNVVPSTISKHVSLLEERLQGQLLLRSTKQLSITELGRRFYERCLAILHEVEEAENELGEYQSEPQGKLRVTAGPTFGAYYLPAIIPQFLARYPKVSLDLKLTPDTLDMIDNAIDVAIRISGNLDPSLIAVKLAPNIRTFCVAPSYIEEHGLPASPQELVRHNCILANETARTAKWPIKGGDNGEFVSVTGNLVINHGEVYRRAILDGLGVGHLSRFPVYDDIKAGRLIELFPDLRIVASHIYVVYPERRNLPLKTRAFIDHVREAFRTPPEWTI